MTLKLQLAALALASLAAVPTAIAQPAPASAQEPPIVITRTLPPSADILMRVVYIADLDLKSAAGQQEMEKRVGRAVEDMCAIPTPLPSYKGKMEKPCRDEAWASARPQMDRVVLMARGS